MEYNNTKILSVQGELDALSSPDLRPTLDVLTRDPGCRIKVDLSEVTLLDSSGVGFLVSLYKRAREHGGSVCVVGIADQPLSIFKLLHLDRVFAVSAPRVGPARRGSIHLRQLHP
jgi:anti-sigma B factor antagonist